MASEQVKSILAQFQEVQNELNNLIDTHQQLLSQLSENQQVLKEFEKLDPDARVFKRLGPVLLPQEFAEAKTNVEKRIDFIQTESQRVDKRIEHLISKRNELQTEIVKSKQAP